MPQTAKPPFQRTILVTDDDQGIRETQGEFLRMKGYRVFEAYDAKETLYCLSENKVDLVITDLFKPDMGGFELTKIIKTKYNIPVIVHTGYHYSEEDAEASGADIIKWVPIPFDELLMEVRLLLVNKTGIPMSERDRALAVAMEIVDPHGSIFWDSDRRIVTEHFLSMIDKKGPMEALKEIERSKEHHRAQISQMVM